MIATLPVAIEVLDLPAELDAGEWTPLAVRITCPPGWPQPVLLRQFRCNRPDTVLTCDLFLQDTEILPGESYGVTLALQVRRPGVLSLADLEVQVDGELYPLGDRAVPVRPSLRQELAVRMEPICTYEEGTKVLVSLTHHGRTTFEDVRLRLGPAGLVRAGKTEVCRGTLPPGRREQFEAVVAPGQLAVRMSARAEGQATTADWELAVPTDVPRPMGRRFRFLEPRSFSQDAVTLFRLDDDGRATEVAKVDGVYPVRGREHYRVVLCPDEGRGVSAARLRELPEQVHVNQSATRGLPGRWEFEVFVSSNAVFSRRARLFYDMETPGGTLTGEIHLRVQPPPLRHLKLALTLGAAATLQSVGILVGALLGGDPDWLQELPRFNPLQGGVHFWFLTSIPLAWVGLRLIDGLQYRWKN